LSLLALAEGIHHHETAPISMACVASHTRWLFSRCISAMSTRIRDALGHVWLDASSRSTEAERRLFDWAPS
jgi:hypothetical protein